MEPLEVLLKKHFDGNYDNVITITNDFLIRNFHGEWAIIFKYKGTLIHQNPNWFDTFQTESQFIDKLKDCERRINQKIDLSIKDIKHIILRRILEDV
jgi:hypothetical protein